MGFRERMLSCEYDYDDAKAMHLLGEERKLYLFSVAMRLFDNNEPDIAYNLFRVIINENEKIDVDILVEFAKVSKVMGKEDEQELILAEIQRLHELESGV